MAKIPEPNFICDASGEKHPRRYARKQWNGLIVHKKYWEPRHPQDFVDPVRGPTAVKDARPEVEPVSATVTDKDSII
jgi:hypothetical protein